ncbi:MAG TPA: signal peptide peptidase SppA, partial [Armatimonadota bacterium]
GLIHVSGLITGGQSSGGLLSGAGAASEDLIKQLREAAKDDSIKAIVLRINSPGGTAAGSQEINQEVQRVRRESHKKVYVSMGDVAASGGYYIASAADRIYANGSTLTGSIGVISSFPQAQGLMGKLGLGMKVMKSGRFKDSGSMFRPMSAEEEALFQKMVMGIYGQFVDAVSAGRKLPRDKVLALADGRVYTGVEAKKLGLVDELGNLQDTVLAAARAAGLKGEPTVRKIGEKGLLSSLMGDPESRANVVTTPSLNLLLDTRLLPMLPQMLRAQ